MPMGMDISSASSVHPAAKAAMTSALQTAGPTVGAMPGASELMAAVTTYAGHLHEAVAEVAKATDVATALKGAGSPLDEAKLKTGVAMLRKALPMKDVIAAVEKLFTDPAVIAKVKAQMAAEHPNTDYVAVHEALNKVHPASVVSFKNLGGALTALSSHQAAATGTLKTSLGEMQSEVAHLLNDFAKDIERLVKICHNLVSAFE